MLSQSAHMSLTTGRTLIIIFALITKINKVRDNDVIAALQSLSVQMWWFCYVISLFVVSPIVCAFFFFGFFLYLIHVFVMQY